MIDNSRSKTQPIILGIDPGYDRVGWCVAQPTTANARMHILKFGLIETNKKDTLFARYQHIDMELQDIINKYCPTEGSIESLFFTKNQKTALHVSEVRGVILSSFFRNAIAFFEYTPLQIKQAVTGFGRAEKTAVERMLRLQFSLGGDKIVDDAIDAIGITLTHVVSRNMRVATEKRKQK
jgi:crossover junction endodeoxyribonuclease RuvC